MFGKDKCKQCGMELEHAVTVKKDGKAFCSDSCATAYAKRSDEKHGCCC